LFQQSLAAEGLCPRFWTFGELFPIHKLRTVDLFRHRHTPKFKPAVCGACPVGRFDALTVRSIYVGQGWATTNFCRQLEGRIKKFTNLKKVSTWGAQSLSERNFMRRGRSWLRPPLRSRCNQPEPAALRHSTHLIKKDKAPKHGNHSRSFSDIVRRRNAGEPEFLASSYRSA